MEDEFLALSSIYPDAFEQLSPFHIRLSFLYQEGTVRLDVIYTNGVPAFQLSVFQCRLPFGTRERIDAELRKCDSVDGIVYEWAEILRTALDALSEGSPINTLTQQLMTTPCMPPFTIFHGSEITDRKSVFIGHCCSLDHAPQMKEFLNYLKQDKKIAQATHNIWAYRLFDGCLRSDCDDDGESAAGARLLHLLDMLKVENVGVVVSRWYGGTPLGPVRFKHINAAARSVLEQNGFIKD